MATTNPLPPISPAEFCRRFAGLVDFENLTLAVEVVAVCSLRCPGCWVAMARPDMWDGPATRVMPPEILGAALAFGRALSASRLTLLGGEPTLHPDLPGVIRHGREAGFEVSVTTNGVCSSARLAAILDSGLRGISFSVDGSRPQIHDALRPSATGRSSFGRTVQSIREAVAGRARGGHRVCVNHTIFPRNLHDAEAMIRLSASLGVDHVRLHFTLPGDWPEPDGAMTYLDPAGWRALLDRLPGIERELGIAISTVAGYGEAAVAAAAGRRSPYLTIQPGGKIVLCAAHARLPSHDSQWVGRLLPTGHVALNPASPVVAAECSGRCCGAIPVLLAGLPGEARAVMARAGGIGCIILNGPLVGR